MSWGRIGHPSEMLKVGQDIDVVVLDINREKERVSLGLKQKMANPWDNIETKYPDWRQGQGPRRQPGALRRVRGTRARRGRPGACHRTVLDQARRETVRSSQAGPGSRSRRAGHQPRGTENLAGHPPARNQSVGQGPGEISARQRRSKARFATSPATAPSSNWRKAWTA